jgi:hypothetical protein
MFSTVVDCFACVSFPVAALCSCLPFLGIVKRFLDALRAEVFQTDVFPSFVESFMSLVKCNLSAEVFRSLALFVTYSLHKTPLSASRTPTTKTRHGTLSSRGTKADVPKRPALLSTTFDNNSNVTSILTKRQIGTSILEMYTEILCEKGSTASLRKFARTVTNKVCDFPQIHVL